MKNILYLIILCVNMSEKIIPIALCLQNKPVNISETVLMFEVSFYQFAGADPGTLVRGGGREFFFQSPSI